MAIRGSVVLECDSKGCHAETVIGDLEFDITPQKRGGLEISTFADGWVEDEHGELHCPQCCEENPRQKGDDDGVEYGHPRDEMGERL
jgi:hypothetical protein